MKNTAVQELKKYFEQQLSISKTTKIKYTVEETLLDAIEICENAIKTKEKQQLISFAYSQIQYIDAEIGDLIYNKTPEEIYNETFNI